jgi:hypothetical protein
MIVASVIGRPWLPGNTNPDSLRGAVSRHSGNAFVTIGSNGMQRWLFADFSAPAGIGIARPALDRYRPSP